MSSKLYKDKNYELLDKSNIVLSHDMCFDIELDISSNT